MKKNILVVDDSALMRRVICDIINTDGTFQANDVCRDGLEAYEKLKTTKYAGVILDVNMPRMDGLQLLEKLQQDKIKATVIMVSTQTTKDADVTIRAMERGAIDFVEKPTNIVEAKGESFRNRLLDVLSAVLRTERENLTMQTKKPEVVLRRQKPVAKSGNLIVALACSTGGPKALQSVIPKLPKNLNAPVVLVQHMPVGFTKSMAERLDTTSPIRVKEAEEGDVLQKGTVYIAPGGKHMEVVKCAGGHKIALNEMPPIGGLRPCANITYDSLKTSGYDEVVCVVLTGMGADGTNGILSLAKSKPVHVIAQNAQTCVVYGMPKAIAESGMVDEVVPLEDVAQTIIKNVGYSNMDVSQYLEVFIDEADEHLQSLSDQIMVLEKEPENMDTINEIFRAAHSLKGMAGTMGFKRMQRLTHDMENVFQEVRSDKIKVNSSMIDLLFKCLDAIEGYLNHIKESSDEGTEDNELIIKELNDFIAGSEGGEKAPEEKKEAPKAEQPSEDADAGKKYFTVELNEAEKAKIKAAEDAGAHIYGFTVSIQKECLLKAARAFLVFKAVEEFGEILVYSPSSQEIEDEHFEYDFSFFVASDEPFEKVNEAAKAVSEIESVVGEEVHYETLVEKQRKAEEVAANEAAKEAEKEAAKETPAAESAPAAPAATAKSASAANSKKQAAAKPVTNRTVRVDIEKLDTLMNQVSELIIEKNSLVSIADSNASSGDGQAQVFHERIESLERITTSLHESVMKVRMVPIESVVSKFPRMIRDLDRKLNKRMELHMTGEDTELDRTVVDQIGDPLQHLLRNSADHGLEDNAVRVQRGKPEVGTIFLNAFQEGNNVIIKVGDDGNGIDVEAVRNKAAERGVITEEQAENMTEKEIINLLFLPSFSMAKKITDISGRGVGLDVVKSGIEALGGDVEVETELGVGTTFTVRLPLTLAIIQALLVEVRDEKYAIALGSISNIEDIPISDIKYVEAKEVIHLRGKVIPLIRLDRMLDCPPKDEEPENLTVVIVQKGDNLTGLVVDGLVGQQEIVIKSLGKYMNNSKIISGATILGDGEVALILDVNTLM